MDKQAQQNQASDLDVVVPFTSPYIEFAKVKPDKVLDGLMILKFPNQCAWCDRDAVVGWRSVQLYEENPQYRPRGQQLLIKGVAAAAAYAVGGSLLGQGLAYSVLKPQDAAKVKGIALNLFVPYCADHATTPHEPVLALVNSRIRVRSAEYAQAIALANSTEGQGINPPTNLLAEARQSITPKVKLSAYERGRWILWIIWMVGVLLFTLFPAKDADMAICVACGWLPGLLVGVIWGFETLRLR